MTKLKGKKKGLVRFFYLDEHKSCIRWRPSRKHDKAKSESDRVSYGHCEEYSSIFTWSTFNSFTSPIPLDI
jgi:phosphatidylinositol phospholipase C eta